MNKNTFETVRLEKGEMHIYDFGTVKLHAYKTNDFIDDEVFIVEKNGKAVLIESPCFFDNNKELAAYLNDVEVEGMLIAYHGAGATFLPDVPKYATQNAKAYSENGGGKALIDNFTGAFGEIFDNSVHKITEYFDNEEAAKSFATAQNGELIAYPGGIAYYNIWIRHAEEIKGKNDYVLQYGIVRNNVYRILLKIKGSGSPKPFEIPTETSWEVYTKPWNLRVQPEIIM